MTFKLKQEEKAKTLWSFNGGTVPTSCTSASQYAERLPSLILYAI